MCPVMCVGVAQDVPQLGKAGVRALVRSHLQGASALAAAHTPPLSWHAAACDPAPELKRAYALIQELAGTAGRAPLHMPRAGALTVKRKMPVPSSNLGKAAKMEQRGDSGAQSGGAGSGGSGKAKVQQLRAACALAVRRCTMADLAQVTGDKPAAAESASLKVWTDQAAHANGMWAHIGGAAVDHGSVRCRGAVDCNAYRKPGAFVQDVLGVSQQCCTARL